jgi:hypothetical protein
MVRGLQLGVARHGLPHAPGKCPAQEADLLDLEGQRGAVVRVCVHVCVCTCMCGDGGKGKARSSQAHGAWSGW